MSFVTHAENGELVYAEEEQFHRVDLTMGGELRITAQDKPVAIWVPSNYEVIITSERGVVLDVAEVVEHHDIVSMEGKIRQMAKEKRRAQNREKRARRRLRGLDRVTE